VESDLAADFRARGAGATIAVRFPLESAEDQRAGDADKGYRHRMVEELNDDIAGELKQRRLALCSTLAGNDRVASGRTAVRLDASCARCINLP
jgi:hypothetical protein